MGFLTQETVNIDRKISAGVIDANSTGQWYDAQVANIPSVFNKNVLTQFDSIPQASTVAIARTNATANPTLISDLSQNASAIRLVVITGSNNSTYLATSTYTAGQYGEALRLRNWIHPTRVPLSSGAPSVGYAIRVFQGNPASGGVEITTTSGLTLTGTAATPAWIFNYDQGILLISDDYKATLTNPYILGFRYIGKTLTETLASLSGGNQSEVDAIELAAGLNTDGTYTAPTGTNFLGASTSIMNAVTLLDTAVYARQTAAQVTTAITSYGYQTAAQVTTAITGYGYQTAAQVATAIVGKANTSSLATVATTGSYSDLVNKPTLFSGSYTDLTNKPTIPTVPTLVSAFTNDSGYLTSSSISGMADTTYVDTQVAGLQTQINTLVTNEIGEVNQAAIDASVAAETTLRTTADAALSARIDALAAATPTIHEGIFVLDVTPTSTGIVGSKTHPTTVPANKVITSCATDTANVRVTVGIDGSAVSYSPTVTIAGVTATVTESSTARWFTAVADITIGAGTTTVSAISNTGATATVSITLAGAGPNISSAVLGAYPNSQTALKAGDIINVTVTAESSATVISIVASGASSVATDYPATNGSAVCAVVVGSGSGSQVFTFKAKNSFGTYGNTFATATVTLDQVAPTFGTLTVTYPSTKGALNTGDSGAVNCTVTGASSVGYSAVGLTIDTPSVYGASKTLTLSSTGYVDSGTNYTIVANKASNGSSATKTGLVLIATTAPTAAITTSPTGRMVGSPTGINYTVTVTSTQSLNAAPSLTASAGAWSGNWSGSGKVWTRTLTISDSTPKGVASFTALAMTNLALVAGSTISSGSAYTVGGFSSRTLTFSAFSRVAAIGANVLDQNKTSCQIVAGNVLTMYTDNTSRTNGYYIANPDGTYNATGNYVGLSDSTFVGSNTSGTLQVTLAEVA